MKDDVKLTSSKGAKAAVKAPVPPAPAPTPIAARTEVPAPKAKRTALADTKVPVRPKPAELKADSKPIVRKPAPVAKVAVKAPAVAAPLPPTAPVTEAAPAPAAARAAARTPVATPAAPAKAAPIAAPTKVEPAVTQLNGFIPSPDSVVLPIATLMGTSAEQARAAYARAAETGETLQHAVTESVSATSRGIVEINTKVLDLIRAQSDAAMDLWRSTLAAGSLSEAVRLHTSGARQAYETTTAQWRDLAETTTRVMGEALKPIQSAWSDNRR
jgi:hypothetical protein